MSKTVRKCVYGRRPPCYILSRIEERKAKARILRYDKKKTEFIDFSQLNPQIPIQYFRQERRRKPDKPDDFVTYEDSDSEEETPQQQNEILNTSYNFVDYVRSRESDFNEVRTFYW